jgi:outer membrane protein OmpA-like peptidoglycan-associated protein
MSYATYARKSEAVPAANSKAASKVVSSGLRIGAPDDAFEREADRVADAVMAGGRPGLEWSFSRMSLEPPLRCKCACGGSASAGGECEECKKTNEILQRASLSPDKKGTEGGGEVPPIVHEVLRSPGQPLDAATRAFFESRFGHDLSQVRLHVDDTATQSAALIRAKAYTVGQHIVLGGRRDITGHVGMKLLAHELTHTIQQSHIETSNRPSRMLQIGAADDCLEREADAAGNAVSDKSWRGNASSSLSTPRVQMQQDEPRKKPKPWIPPVGDFTIDFKLITPFVSPSLSDVQKGLDSLHGGSPKDTDSCEISRGTLKTQTSGICKGLCGPERPTSRAQCCPSFLIDTMTGRCCAPDETIDYLHHCVKKSSIRSGPVKSPIPIWGWGPGPSVLPPQTQPQAGSIGKLKPSPFFLASVGSLTVGDFGWDKSDLTAEQKTRLDNHAKTLGILLAMDPDATIEIWGYTDATGTEQYNIGLGQKRAEAARKELVTAGVPANKLHVHSAGESQLRVKTSAANPSNRRVEIRFEPSLKLAAPIPMGPYLTPPTLGPQLSSPGPGGNP